MVSPNGLLSATKELIGASIGIPAILVAMVYFYLVLRDPDKTGFMDLVHRSRYAHLMALGCTLAVILFTVYVFLEFEKILLAWLTPIPVGLLMQWYFFGLFRTSLDALAEDMTNQQ